MNQANQYPSSETHSFPPTNEVVYADRTVNLEVTKVGAMVDLGNGGHKYFNVLSPASTIGFSGVDYDGNRKNLVIIGGQTAVLLTTQKGERTSTYKAWDLGADQLDTFRSPFMVGSRSQRLGFKIEKISAWLREGSTDAPSSDKSNPLRVANDINNRRLGIS